MARIPSKSEILDWIAENPAKGGKRDIARAFGIKGSDRVALKAVLRELKDQGHLEKRRKSYREPGSLPPVAVLRIIGPDDDGDLMGEPQDWQGEGDAPRAIVLEGKGRSALGPGDRVLARLTKVAGEHHAYGARPIRRIGHAPQSLVGIFRTTAEGGRIVPVEKRAQSEWQVRPGATGGARDGELVEAEAAGTKRRMGLSEARVITRLGDPGAPKAVSLIAIHAHGIPDHFPQAVLAEAETAAAPKPGAREDLRHIPFVTIDPADARDRDDAVWAELDAEPANKGGHVVWVAIADVAHFVRSGTALDTEARRRGNSTYFPDRVVAMLPDRLSGDLASLHDGVDRAVIAVRMVLNAEGRKIAHGFHRGRISSRASPRRTARQVGTRLAAIHRATAGRADLRERFDTGGIFHAIRLEPYLLATAERHPDLRPRLAGLAAATAETRLALVHGDLSPKNILVGPRGPVFLDAECAWYGDPAFDIAFCLNHLLLKCLWTPDATPRFLACFGGLAGAYLEGVDWERPERLEARAAALLPGLLLARVDGKSPVEYVTTDRDRNLVRGVARRLLHEPAATLAAVQDAWASDLPRDSRESRDSREYGS